MIILTLWVTGFGLLSSSSITLEKWPRCQIGWPSWLSRDNYGAKTGSVKGNNTHLERRLINMLVSHLQYQWDTCREEGHKHKVVGQDRHAAKAAHDFQLSHTWKILGKRWLTAQPNEGRRLFITVQKDVERKFGRIYTTLHTVFHFHHHHTPFEKCLGCCCNIPILSS